MQLPIRIYSESNIHEHWSKKNKRKKQQQHLVKMFLRPYRDELVLPVTITLIRCGIRLLDDDNLVTAFKGIRDAIADLITPGMAPGRADDLEGLSFRYDQKKDKEYFMEIEVS